MMIVSTEKDLQQSGLLDKEIATNAASVLEPPVDYLQEMLDTQQQYQYDHGFDFDKMTVQERVDYIKRMSLYLQAELYEFLRELPFFKDWKVYEEATEAITPAAREELIDVIHFLLNIIIASGLSSKDVYEEYKHKITINRKRLEDTAHYKRSIE